MLEELKSLANVEENVSLVKYNTYHIGGTAKYFITPNSVNNLISISSYAFAQCKNLKNITIPDSINYIGQETFWDCDKLNSVTFENKNGWYITSNSNSIEGTNIDVSNVGTNAVNLKNTYRDYYWKRN